MLTVIVLSLLFSINSLAVEDGSVIPEFEYYNFQLNNGLEVYVFEDHSIPLVEIDILK